MQNKCLQIIYICSIFSLLSFKSSFQRFKNLDKSKNDFKKILTDIKIVQGLIKNNISMKQSLGLSKPKSNTRSYWRLLKERNYQESAAPSFSYNKANLDNRPGDETVDEVSKKLVISQKSFEMEYYYNLTIQKNLFLVFRHGSRSPIPINNKGRLDKLFLNNLYNVLLYDLSKFQG